MRRAAVPAVKSSEIERTLPMRKSVNPTLSEAVDDPSKVERRVMCTNYERYLDEAIKRNWVGFTCRHCLSFEPLTLDPIEWLAHSLACIPLVYVAEFPSTRALRKPKILRDLGLFIRAIDRTMSSPGRIEETTAGRLSA
jgi:hypothetical protein